MDDIIEPEFSIDMEGYRFLGRGPGASGGGGGWSRDPSILYRCVKCGDTMKADCNEYFTCQCGSLFIDVDYHRFGSDLGEQNILVYRRL